MSGETVNAEQMAAMLDQVREMVRPVHAMFEDEGYTPREARALAVWSLTGLRADSDPEATR